MKGKVKEYKVFNNPKVSTGMEIGSDNRSVPIKVVENNKANQTGFVARIFHRASENKWLAQTTETTRGLIVYVDKKPLLGQKIQITGVHERHSIGIIVDPK
jgi:uncharacterized protein (DUF2126 family)